MADTLVYVLLLQNILLVIYRLLLVYRRTLQGAGILQLSKHALCVYRRNIICMLAMCYSVFVQNRCR